MGRRGKDRRQKESSDYRRVYVWTGVQLGVMNMQGRYSGGKWGWRYNLWHGREASEWGWLIMLIMMMWTVMKVNGRLYSLISAHHQYPEPMRKATLTADNIKKRNPARDPSLPVLSPTATPIPATNPPLTPKFSPHSSSPSKYLHYGDLRCNLGTTVGICLSAAASNGKGKGTLSMQDVEGPTIEMLERISDVLRKVSQGVNKGPKKTVVKLVHVRRDRGYRMTDAGELNQVNSAGAGGGVSQPGEVERHAPGGERKRRFELDEEENMVGRRGKDGRQKESRNYRRVYVWNGMQLGAMRVNWREMEVEIQYVKQKKRGLGTGVAIIMTTRMGMAMKVNGCVYSLGWTSVNVQGSSVGIRLSGIENE